MDDFVDNNVAVSRHSPPDDGELKDSDEKKSDQSMDATEAFLRKKLLKKQQQKNSTTRTRRVSDEEEMFTMQPQETRKKERQKAREDEDRERQRERERANRKPIRWELSRDNKEWDKERDRSKSSSVRHSYSKNDRLSPPPLPYRRSSRELDDHKDTDPRFDKSSRRPETDSRTRHRHRHDKHHRHEKIRRTPEPVRLPLDSMSRRSATSDAAPSKRVSDSLPRRGPSSSSDLKTEEKLAVKRTASIIDLASSSLSRSGPSDGSAQPTNVNARSRSPVAERISDSSSHESPSPQNNDAASEIPAIEVSAATESPPNKRKRSITPVLPDTSEHNMGKHTPVSEDEEAESPAHSAYKKSKFESSPEMDDDDISLGDDLSDPGAHELDEPVDVVDMDDTLNLSELERKGFDNLTDEEKAMLSPDTLERMEKSYQKKLISMLPVYYPGIDGCRNVNEFECVNRIEEGTFGVVFRAVEKKTDEVVALKRLKMENELNGFPITSLREINMLLKCGGHPNIVNLREIVVGSNMDKIYLVMEYVDHDMKALMETMSKKNKCFTIGQVKTLMQQLLSGVQFLHQEYVIHRDLKTSNLLLTRNGILKIGDFGLAREFGEPLKPFTPIVVTLWYRSPELLLGVKEYSTAVDMWSVGCIFGEFLQFKPLFPGRGEVDQLNKIFTEIGTPNEKIWPGYTELPGVVKFAFVDTPFNQLRKKIDKSCRESLTDEGFELLNRLLAPCPARRHSASTALHSKWFLEDPHPVDPSLFPTWPSKSDAFSKDKPVVAPAAPKIPPGINAAQLKLMEDLKVDARHVSGDGFSLKFDVAKF